MKEEAPKRKTGERKPSLTPQERLIQSLEEQVAFDDEEIKKLSESNAELEERMKYLEETYDRLAGMHESLKRQLARKETELEKALQDLRLCRSQLPIQYK